MGRIEDTFEWCLKKSEKGGVKHKGLKKIKADNNEAEKQIKKAESDLETMDYLYKGKKTDWVSSTAFYAMYHALLSILYKMGYESRNQECTIIAIEKLMKNKAISLEQEYIDMIRSVEEKEDAKSVREKMQYSSETSLEDERCKKLMNDAKKFVDRAKEIIEELSVEENESQ